MAYSTMPGRSTWAACSSHRPLSVAATASAADVAEEPHRAPNGQPFPEAWGAPPAAQTRDLRDLPAGYGQGSGTLYTWIEQNLLQDSFRGIFYGPSGKQFPEEWGKPPLAQTRDLVDLPAGYGEGSGTLASWIAERVKADDAAGILRGPSGKAFPKHWGALPEVMTADVVPLPAGFGEGSSGLGNWIKSKIAADAARGIHYSSSGKQFPQRWGSPPERDSRDLVMLPSGYGRGSSTLAAWIAKSIEDDPEVAVHKAPSGKAFPKHWGSPPEVMTADVVALPFGYGEGSSGLLAWIQRHSEFDKASLPPRSKL